MRPPPSAVVRGRDWGEASPAIAQNAVALYGPFGLPALPPAQRRDVAVGVAGARKGDRLAGRRRSGPIRVNFGATTTAARRAETTAKITLWTAISIKKNARASHELNPFPQGREGQGVTASSKTTGSKRSRGGAHFVCFGSGHGGGWGWARVLLFFVAENEMGAGREPKRGGFFR